MALQKIHLRPGVSVELTPTALGASYSQSQLIRFFAGQLQKYGGWQRMVGVAPLLGTCRGLFGWADLVGTAHLAAGTEQRLYVVTGGIASDITPGAASSSIAVAVATTALSPLVTIFDASYAPSAGDTVNVVVPISAGGIILQGFYVVQAKGAGQYTVQAASPEGRSVRATPAVSTQASGGSVPSYTSLVNSAQITVKQVGHLQTVGSAYVVHQTTTVGSLALLGSYSVTAVLDANTFRFSAAGLAGSTQTVAENGGLMLLQYLLPAGQAENASLGGWGVGDWGAGDWGRSSAGVTSSLVTKARTWSLDHFGQDLIASPDLGAIYHWAPPTVAPAVVVSGTAPTINRIVVAIAQAQIIIAFGSSVGANYFPTFIRWCDSGDFTDWVAASGNQAGSYQIPTGSFFSAALVVGLGVLVWTDTDLYAATYQGLPYVFSFVQIAVRCEALSKRAPAAIGSNRVIWPSSKTFFTYSGSVAPLECPVWDFFYDNLDASQAEQVFAAVNALFNEVAWFFPAIGGGTNYVKFNYLEDVWDYGTLNRTAWFDHSPYGSPVATDAAGLLYQHETTADADGTAMAAFGQSGYFDVADGNVITLVNTLIPDFVASLNSSIQITLLVVDYPGQTPPRSYGPFTVTPTTRRINCSARGRQVAFRIASNDIGSAWRVGAIRYSSKPAGTRP